MCVQRTPAAAPAGRPVPRAPASVSHSKRIRRIRYIPSIKPINPRRRRCEDLLRDVLRLRDAEYWSGGDLIITLVACYDDAKDLAEAELRRRGVRDDRGAAGWGGLPCLDLLCGG